ncbi:MAG: DUF2726 domain-containing protein [Planctomycetota bacterium]
MQSLQSNPGCMGRLLQLLAGGGATGKGASSGDGPWPYRRRKYLLSRAEFSFFRVLQSVALENGWVVCAKVNLNDLLYLEKGAENRMAWLNKINRKHADFVLCDAQTMQPVMVVELDDKCHQSASAQKRDGVKDRALAAAGLPIVRVKAAKGYEPAAVRDKLANGLASA